MMNYLFSFFILFSIPFSTMARPSNPNAVVASINGTKILAGELEVAYQQNALFVSDKKVTRESVLLDLINRELGIQKAKQAKLENDPTVKYKMEDILFHAQVSKDLEGKLKEIVVTDKDLKDYYVKFPEYRTAHILFRTTINPKDDEVKAALAQSLKVYEELRKSPEKFPEMANRFSQSSTAPAGGDMGFQPAKALAPEYFKAINGKPVGYIAPPVHTAFGFHIVKILAINSFDQINVAYYKKIIHDIKRDEIMEQYFAAQRKSAKIEIDKKMLE
ncbi:MAG TPA: peptidylprolyl isomerase [Bacteriovoracaceae bacterium]|nr:peptidylprolyl isomerase [Bacteriovoracaceae bacterium]